MNVSVRIRNRISSTFNTMFVSALYEARVGIKCFNQIISSEMFEYFVVDNSEEIISTDNLYLAFDGLKDRYSLLDKLLIESPHFGLIKSISSNEDARTTEYVARRNNGTLDFLGPVSLSSQYIDSLCRKFRERKRLIELQEYEPIKVVLINGKHYIFDGKHTAATCALLGVSPKCVDVTPVVFDSFFWWVRQKMSKHAADYQKHMQWFDSAKTAYIEKSKLTASRVDCGI